ncbi:MAG: metallophosphoesterase, partial [Bacteroidetes bacterium]|nr:metallophosphoesterase [Bacteroidota bacterium]
MRYLFIMLLIGSLFPTAFSQNSNVPKSHRNIIEKDGVHYLKLGEDRYFAENEDPPEYTLEALKGNPKGTKTGLRFDFDNKEFSGKLFYGFIPYGDSRHPHPVFFRQSSDIVEGGAEIDIIKYLSGRYDMIGWEKSGRGTLGYRVVATSGRIIYDGVVTFSGTGPFDVDITVIEGPFVNLLTPEGATISFETNKKTKASIEVDGKSFADKKATTHHEILISGLEPDKVYDYKLVYGENSLTYGFKTAPKPGSRSSFTFAYASDSRSGQGGGERDIYGANAYIMKKIMALATQQKVAFFQFSGDLINGYLNSPEAMDLQYANWKRAIQPFAHYFPVYVSMGNHEALGRIFYGDKGEYVFVDRFPFETESAEAVFKRNFVNPQNGPAGEDGADYDPDPKSIDFPSYDENVFYYTYDNVAVIVMNSDYWYSPSTGNIPLTGGGLHG